MCWPVKGKRPMKYVQPGQPVSIVAIESRYGNFIGGKWLAPAAGR
jgi:aldehyde dehydrogenase